MPVAFWVALDQPYLGMNWFHLALGIVVVFSCSVCLLLGKRVKKLSSMAAVLVLASPLFAGFGVIFAYCLLTLTEIITSNYGLRLPGIDGLLFGLPAFSLIGVPFSIFGQLLGLAISVRIRR